MQASALRPGMVIKWNNDLYSIFNMVHRTPGNLRAFVQVRMRNLNTGNTFETRFSSTELVQEARLDTKEMQVMYKDVNGIHVMDASTYEQFSLDEETTGEMSEWLEPGMTFMVEWLFGRPIAIQLPSMVELEIVDTAPVMKTATKTASSKPAKLSNGATVNIPEFIGPGEKIRVNPNTGEYLERVR